MMMMMIIASFGLLVAFPDKDKKIRRRKTAAILNFGTGYPKSHN